MGRGYSDEARRDPGGGRCARGLPRLRGRRLHHRADRQCRWRLDHVLDGRSAAAAVRYLGAVDWALPASLLAVSVPGILASCPLATRVPGLVLRPVLAGTHVLVDSRPVA